MGSPDEVRLGKRLSKVWPKNVTRNFLDDRVDVGGDSMIVCDTTPTDDVEFGDEVENVDNRDYSFEEKIRYSDIFARTQHPTPLDSKANSRGQEPEVNTCNHSCCKGNECSIYKTGVQTIVVENNCCPPRRPRVFREVCPCPACSGPPPCPACSGPPPCPACSGHPPCHSPCPACSSCPSCPACQSCPNCPAACPGCGPCPGCNSCPKCGPGPSCDRCCQCRSPCCEGKLIYLFPIDACCGPNSTDKLMKLLECREQEQRPRTAAAGPQAGPAPTGRLKESRSKKSIDTTATASETEIGGAKGKKGKKPPKAKAKKPAKKKGKK